MTTDNKSRMGTWIGSGIVVGIIAGAGIAPAAVSASFLARRKAGK
jgi:hypothetical protein